VLALYKADIIIIASNVVCYRHDMAEKNDHFALNNDHSITHFPFGIFKPSL
jgi:hypothetical protein